MLGAKLRVHPLFLAVGILSAAFGGLPVFLAATVAALEHEAAHALAARRYGYRLDKIVLMPYGAVVSGEIAGMGRGEKLFVLFAGPLANGLTALLFAAIWWLYPETYPYTDTAAYVSLSLFIVNLLPAYPLDGGRVLRLLLERISKRAAAIGSIVSGGVTALAVLGYFIYTCVKGAPMLSALAFAVLLVTGLFSKGGSYKPVFFARDKSVLRGIEERRVVLSAERTLSDALRYLSEEKYLVLVLYRDGEYFGEMTEEEYLKALEGGDYQRSLAECYET